MKGSLVVACLFLLITLPASAQRGGRSGAGRPRVLAPDQSSGPLMLVSGKVVVDDGTTLTDSVSIQTVCRGQRRTEAHTDSKGNFSFQLGGRSTGPTADYDVDSSSSAGLGRANNSRNIEDCDLEASLVGFTSESIHLGARLSGGESGDIGRLVLHRVAAVEGFTISATTAQAPESARKALRKGQEQVKKEKWDDAQKSFEKAVALYPKFAVAWYELGRIQIHKNDAVAARTSFNRSIAADDKYINPYHTLSQMALHDQSWAELVILSNKLLSLNPLNFPEAWLWNSMGNYCVQNLQAAEKSARRGLEVDTDHHVPRLEYLLGIVLLKKPDYQQAAHHLRAFLTLTRQPVEIAETQKQLDEIARLSPTATTTVSEKQ